jgi:hypothetical protein
MDSEIAGQIHDYVESAAPPILLASITRPSAAPGRVERNASIRRQLSPRRATALAAATAAAAALIIAGVAVTVPSRTASVGPRAARPRAVGFQRGPSLGVAANAVELVDYATQSAASTPVLVPGPDDWEYFKKFYGLSASGGPDGVGVAETWQQVGTSRNIASWHHGALTYGSGGGPGAQLTGWPGPNWTNMYQYLASLPAQPSALRKIILANNNGDPVAAFTAIEAILVDFPVSARFQAELYAVLVSLPGVQFARHAVDAAERPGIGLYLVQRDHVNEAIINPRTYVYMGGLVVTVPGHPSHDTVLTHPSKGKIIENVAILNSGIVGRSGQLP